MEFLAISYVLAIYLLVRWLQEYFSPTERRHRRMRRAPRCSADHLHAVGRCEKDAR